MPYSLRCSISAHSNDVRCLALLDYSIISGSRDRTLKTWTERGKNYEETTTASCHAHFISSVCVLPPCDLFPQGIIFSGGHDQKIIGYIPHTNKPLVTMTGHNGTVCSLTPSKTAGHLISSSWDATIKIWDITSGQCINTLFGHSQTVWCVIHIPEDYIVSGSADKSIIVYSSDGTYIRTLYGHTDCVRGLAYAEKEIILSCGNDGTIRKWKVTSGDMLEVFECHDSFIYSVASLNSTVVFGGEDNILSVWSGGMKGYSERQTLHLPATSVWAVAILPNMDIVAACSDGFIRIFTQDPSRAATREEIAEYEREFSRKKEVNGGSNTLNLPGKEALAIDGEHHGDIKLIHDDGVNYCYSWNLETRNWDLVGEECSPPTENTVSEPANVPVTVKYFPPDKHIIFENYDLQLICKKLSEFMQQMNLKEDDVNRILNSLKTLATTSDGENITNDLNVLMEAVAEWPEALVYPVLDITRICVLNSAVHPKLFSDENASKLFNSLNRFMKIETSVNNKMFLFRILANMFSGEQGKNLVYAKKESLLPSLPDLITSKHKGLEIAVSTFILNMCLASLHKKDMASARLCFAFIRRIIPHIKDPEAIFRILVALGTIGNLDETEFFTEDILTMLVDVSSWGNKDAASGKASSCAESIIQKLKR